MFCVVCVLPPFTCVDVQYFSYKLPAGGGKRSWNFRSNKMPQVRTARSCCVAARGSLSLRTVYSSIADRLLQGIELSPAAHYPPLSSHYSSFPVRSRQCAWARQGPTTCCGISPGLVLCFSETERKKKTHTRVARGQAVNHGRNRVLRSKITAESLQRDASC